MEFELSIELEVLSVVGLSDLVSPILGVEIVLFPQQALLEKAYVAVGELLMQGGIAVTVDTILSQTGKGLIVCKRLLGLQSQYIYLLGCGILL